MFGFGWIELLIVATVAIALFAWRLPEVMRSLERGPRGGQGPLLPGSGWVYPPGKPRPPFDDELKTSRLFIGLCVLIVVAVAIVSWWLKP